MRKIVKGINIALAFALFNIWTLLGYYTAKLPDNFYVENGEKLKLNTVINITAEMQDKALQSSISDTIPISQKATLKLFGILPVKDVEVVSVDTPVLVPGGAPFGIKLLMDGVMVVGMGEIECNTGHNCPAVNAGIKKGDVIIEVNDEEVDTNKELQKIISESDGEPVDIVLIRDGNEINLELQPVYSEENKTYQAGMWVRDSTAGIGTMTFYDPTNDAFAGLGHPICDVDTGEIIPLSSGEIVNVSIDKIKKGVEGYPGELQGSFTAGKAIGTLTKNNKYGVFGMLNNHPDTSKALPMGLKQDIKTGEATIYTTINGSVPQEFKISIEKIDYKSKESSKNMVIRITDEELLEKTGGIVQGMSGSPIIQDGKIIGAVTHVFVNDPTRGYGIFCENMYELGL